MKHMSSCRSAFDTYDIITPIKIYLGDDNIVKTIGMGSIIVEVIVKDKKRIYNKDNLYISKL